MFLLLLFSLCFCIFHDLIKDFISTLTHIVRRFAIQGVPKATTKGTNRKAVHITPPSPLVEGNKTETWPNSANGRRRRRMETAPTTQKHYWKSVHMYLACVVYMFCDAVGHWGSKGASPWLAWHDGITSACSINNCSAAYSKSIWVLRKKALIDSGTSKSLSKHLCFSSSDSIKTKA